MTTTEHLCGDCPDHRPAEHDININDAVRLEGIGLVAMTEKQVAYVRRSNEFVPLAAITTMGNVDVNADFLGKPVRLTMQHKGCLILNLEQVAMLHASIERFTETLGGVHESAYQALHTHAWDVLVNTPHYAGDIDKATDDAEAHANSAHIPDRGE